MTAGVIVGVGYVSDGQLIGSDSAVGLVACHGAGTPADGSTGFQPRGAGMMQPIHACFWLLR